MISVAIIGGGLQGISTARSLESAGYRVGMYSKENDFAIKSTALSFKQSVPEITIAGIKQFLKKNNVEVAIPMSDGLAHLLSTNKSEILSETSCLVAVPDPDIFSLASDKLKLMEFCKIHNFPHPFTLPSSRIQSLDGLELKFPVLIKPNHSVGARGIKKINQAETLLSSLKEVERQFGECHIQEFVEQNGRPYYNVMLYRDRFGNCENIVTLEISRYYPLGAGSSCLCKTIDNPILSDLTKQVLDELNYIGFADFDILQDNDGNYKIIEINPRVPASLRGAQISNVNFPDIIVKDALQKEVPKYKYEPGKHLRYLGLDLLWFISSKERFKTHPSWFKFFDKNTFYQEGGWEDKKAMFHAFISNFNKLEFKKGRLRKKPTL